MPSAVGSDPTITQPEVRMPERGGEADAARARAGQVPGLIVAKVTHLAADGEICTIVVPVPCWFAELLKLLTRMSPLCSAPTDFGTVATP